MHRGWLLHRPELRAARRTHLPRRPRRRRAGGDALTGSAARRLLSGAPALAFTAFIALFAGCRGCSDGAPVACAGDADCDPAGEGFLRCDVDLGACLCNDDRGCGAGETCNALGRCQARSGCDSNADCNSGFFCDVTRNRCIADDECGLSGGRGDCCVLDSQCGFQQVCDALTLRCTDGCRDEADCFLGEACVRAPGQVIGRCDDEVCDRDALCDFGELCGSDGRCVPDRRGPYCEPCSGGIQSDDCGAPGNFCLLDLVNGGSFCGVDASANQDCPFGYEARDIIILPPAASTCDAESCVIDDDGVGRCAVNGGRCAEDADCPIGFPGGTCARAEVGNCEREQQRSCSDDADCGDADRCVLQECRYREGALRGTCSCTRASDCSLGDTCRNINPVDGLGTCQLSGHDCYADEDCEAILQCINGGCYIGRNCTPASGRTCRDFVDEEPVLNP